MANQSNISLFLLLTAKRIRSLAFLDRGQLEGQRGSIIEKFSVLINEVIAGQLLLILQCPLQNRWGNSQKDSEVIYNDQES